MSRKKKGPRPREATTPVPQLAPGPDDPPRFGPLGRGAGLAAILLLAAGLRFAWSLQEEIPAVGRR